MGSHWDNGVNCNSKVGGALAGGFVMVHYVVHDPEIPTMQDLKAKSPKAGDKLEVKNKKGLVWDDLTDDEGNKVSVIRGTTQHHLIPGAGYWRSVIDLDGKRYKGKSIMEDDGYVMTLEEVVDL